MAKLHKETELAKLYTMIFKYLTLCGGTKTTKTKRLGEVLYFTNLSKPFGVSSSLSLRNRAKPLLHHKPFKRTMPAKPFPYSLYLLRNPIGAEASVRVTPFALP